MAQPTARNVRIKFGTESDGANFNLSPNGNLDDAATNLFAMLRLVNRQAIDIGTERTAVVRMSFEWIGIAGNGRLARATCRDHADRFG